MGTPTFLLEWRLMHSQHTLDRADCRCQLVYLQKLSFNSQFLWISSIFLSKLATQLAKFSASESSKLANSFIKKLILP